MVRVWDIVADLAMRAGIRADPREYDDDDWFLQLVSLNDDEWRTLTFLSRSMRDFVSLSEGLNFIVANRLLEMRLVERGRISTSDEAYPMGYRLTSRGEAVMRRGKYSPSHGM